MCVTLLLVLLSVRYCGEGGDYANKGTACVDCDAYFESNPEQSGANLGGSQSAAASAAMRSKPSMAAAAAKRKQAASVGALPQLRASYEVALREVRHLKVRMHHASRTYGCVYN